MTDILMPLGLSYLTTLRTESALPRRFQYVRTPIELVGENGEEEERTKLSRIDTPRYHDEENEVSSLRFAFQKTETKKQG